MERLLQPRGLAPAAGTGRSWRLFPVGVVTAFGAPHVLLLRRRPLRKHLWGQSVSAGRLLPLGLVLAAGGGGTRESANEPVTVKSSGVPGQGSHHRLDRTAPNHPGTHDAPGEAPLLHGGSQMATGRRRKQLKDTFEAPFSACIQVGLRGGLRGCLKVYLCVGLHVCLRA